MNLIRRGKMRAFEIKKILTMIFFGALAALYLLIKHFRTSKEKQQQ